MAGKAIEEIKFQFISPDVLAISEKEEHAQYFKDISLSRFVSQVPWKNRHRNTADMLELIRNFDRNVAKSVVKGVVVSFDVESVRNIFRLEYRGQADEKPTNYPPKTFSCKDRGKSNRAYPLQSCTDDMVRERLTFQLAALHMKGKRVETVALYQILEVEESVRIDWGRRLASKLVELMIKAQESIFQKRTGGLCTFASHLQVMLSMAVNVASTSLELPSQVTMEGFTVKQHVHTEHQARQQRMYKTNCTDIVEEQKRASDSTRVQLISSQLVGEAEHLGYQTKCSSHCMQIVAELKRDHALLMKEHTKMTTTVGELSKELGTLKAVQESLAKQVYASRTNNEEDTADAVLSKAATDMDTGNQKNRNIAGMLCPPYAGSNGVQLSMAHLCIELNDDASDGKVKNSTLNRPMDNEIHRRTTPFLSTDNKQADCNAEVAHSKEKRAIVGHDNTVPVPSPTTKAMCSLHVKRTKLLQQTLNLPRDTVSTNKPQSAKRRLDMNMETGARCAQGRKARRARRKWTEAETVYLQSSVERYGEKWTTIAFGGSGILMGRTGGDCKDKWRNLTGGD